MTETKRDSLNVRLAKWAGWRVEQRQLDAVDWYYVLFRSDGARVTANDGGYEVDEFWTEDEAWQHAPDYEGSLDAGMALVPREYSVTFGNAIIGGRYCVIDDLDGNKWSNAGVYTATDSAALAHALDAMRQQQEAGR